MIQEIWKDIEGYEGYYQVSNMGKVKSLPRFKNFRNLKVRVEGKVLNPAPRTKNYLWVSFRKDHTLKQFSIHRLVAKAFIPNLENKAEVNHIDGNKLNNRMDNLEWMTRVENAKHAAPVYLRGEKNPKSKFTPDQIEDIRRNYTGKWGEKTRLSEKYNVTLASILNIIKLKSWSHLSKSLQKVNQ